MKEALSKLRQKQSLSAPEMTAAMEEIISGRAVESEIEQFLLLLREKGETVGEIVAAAKVMRAHSVKLSKTYPDLLDTCGTGGDSKNTINVSTLAAIVACAAGIKIAKHGNRSVTSVCGSADLLEALGIVIDLPPESIERCIEATGFGFFYAPHFHPAVRFAMPARRRIQGKTIFNTLGPLCNPAGAAYQLIGVYDERLVEKMAEALFELGIKRAMVVHGKDGLDEITLCDETKVAELNQGKVRVYRIKPEDFGLKRARLEDLHCRSLEECVEAANKILIGEPGPKTDIVHLNAAAALYVAGEKASLEEAFQWIKRQDIPGLGWIRPSLKHSEICLFTAKEKDRFNASLDGIVAYKRKEINMSKREAPLETLKGKLVRSRPKRGFLDALKSSSGVAVIAEVKKRSPSKGLLRKDFDPVQLGMDFEKAGAKALSILTDGNFFAGSPDYIEAVAAKTSLPILRKDFILDEYQVYESKSIGADAILLIASILTVEQLKSFSALAKSLELDVLFEVHSEEEIKKVLEAEPQIIGINNRDLKTFQVDLRTTEKLISLLPKNVVIVSESGIQDRIDLKYLEKLGVKAALVGESLMKADNPGQALWRLLRDS